MHLKSKARRRLPSYSAVVSTLALVFALGAFCIGGAMATGVIVTSKQIKNGSILSQDIHRDAVKTSDIGRDAVGSADIKNESVEGADIGNGQVGGADIGAGQVDSSDIGNGQVTPQDVTMPDPKQLQESDTSVADIGGDAFVLLDSVGTYVKEDSTSVLEVNWTGTVGSPSGSGCIFQLRVDQQPSAASGGLTFLQSGPEAASSVSADALFTGLQAGPHTVEVWARQTQGPGTTRCIVGPASPGISQTFVVSEQVI